MQLGPAWLLVVLLAPVAAAGLDPAHEELPVLGESQEAALGATLGRIGAIRAPLLARPAFAHPSGSFDVELALPDGAILQHLWLQTGATTCAAEVGLATNASSVAWPDVALQVSHARARLADCPPGLYDLHARYRAALGVVEGTVEDRQVNAVRVMSAARWDALARGAAHPRVVVIADPQIGDPRAIAQAAQEDPARVPAVLDGTLGNGGAGPDGRWKAVRHAFLQAKAADPDLVVLAGDLGFGQLVPGSYAAEYEEIWRVLAEADVPIFAAPGNHDGYVANGQDGFAYWRAYIGPTYTLAPSVPGTWLLVMNTYDWSELDRMGVSYAVSAWGGQVREEQLAWIGSALAQLRVAEPAARVLAVSHHSPGWRQDAFDPSLEGVPVAEQVERGAVTYATTDQGWVGRNRLPLRDLLRAFDVEVAFAGHTHRDRIARDDGAGGIVGTTQTTQGMPDGFDPRLLHHWTRDDALVDGATQEQLAAMLRADTGPLYIDTTTAMSDTRQYWGYRVARFHYDESGALDLSRLGHPLTHAELDALAHEPEMFNASHAAFGLFSTPLGLG